MTTRDVYRALSAWTLIKAAWRGPKALAKTLVRRQAHKTLARGLRRVL